MSRPPERRRWRGEWYELLGVYADRAMADAIHRHLKELGRLGRIIPYRTMIRGEERDAFALYVNPRHDRRTAAGREEKKRARRKAEPK